MNALMLVSQNLNVNFYCARRTPATPPTTTESIDDFLQLPPEMILSNNSQKQTAGMLEEATLSFHKTRAWLPVHPSVGGMFIVHHVKFYKIKKKSFFFLLLVKRAYPVEWVVR